MGTLKIATRAAPLAADLMKEHTVVVPDLRGIGRSSKPADATIKRLRQGYRAVGDCVGIRQKHLWLLTTSATWWPTRTPPLIPIKVERLASWTHRIPGIDLGTRFS